MVRLYAQLRPGPGETEFDHSKWGPEEVLGQLNKIFAPYTLKYASPCDWYTILTSLSFLSTYDSEANTRLQSMSVLPAPSPTRTVSSWLVTLGQFSPSTPCVLWLISFHSHVHSAKGAFGMNTGIMDAQNLAWKLAFLSKGIALPKLLDTYDVERRENALRAVATSARYLRFVGNCTFESIDGDKTHTDVDETKIVAKEGEDPHVAFFRQFAQDNERFLIGLDVDYRANTINKPVDPAVKNIRSGYRAPDPRVSLDKQTAGRLYDSFAKVSRFTIVIFGSNLQGAIAPKLQALDAYLASPKSFLKTYSVEDIFKVVVVARALPYEADASFKQYPFLSKTAQLVYDDQLPPGIFGADAHSLYGANHTDGAVVVVRPDTWVGTAVTVEKAAELESYFSEFLIPA